MNAIPSLEQRAAAILAAPTEGPEPLRRPVPPASPYPFDTLGPLLGKAARRIHEVVQAPDAVCGQSVLAAASLAVQGLANVAINGRTHPLSLWCITVAESGERKSAADGWALRAHVKFEHKRVTDYATDWKAHKLALNAHEDASKAAKAKDKDKGRAAILSALEAVGDAPEPPLLPQLLCSEPTLEGLHKLLQNGFPSLGLFTDEAGQLFGGYAMGKDNVMKSAAGLSKLWDGAAIDRIRAGDGAVKLYGKRLALHAMMQPVVAEAVLSNDVLTGQGFLARALLASPAGLAGHRVLSDVDLSADPDLNRYWCTMRDRLERPMPMLPDTRNELAPRALSLTAGARATWATVYGAIESDQTSSGEYSQVKPWASKAAEQALRIAGVLALAADSDTANITADDITNAAKLVDWHLGEAVRLVGMAATKPEVKHAEAILEWARERGKVHVYSAELVRLGPNCIRDGSTLRAAMQVLESARWAFPLDEGMALDGAHRRNVWRLARGDEA